MRFLKRLQLQGYKTFAARTDFEFDAGVTAIVGPNGSGKSNIADALRWVLGEQSFSALRGKRTEDMIFSGSEQRARLGMAYASVVLDNTSGWLPIDFSEVEITRRAYRSGDNEYYLNGNRVRLRDINDLLGSSGLSERTYTVIGQGLIDQALSLRPEERRKLFEEAAGITVHQDKRADALQKLADARTNLTRAQDIISELTPRLRYLKGQARRASEYRQIKADLEAQLRIWYGYKWRQDLQALAAAKVSLADSTDAAEEQVAALALLERRVAALRNERNLLRDQLGGWHRASSDLHRQSETVQRELAVRSEQVRLWGEQREELARELAHLQVALEDSDARLQVAQTELAEAESAHAAKDAIVAEARQALAGRERERQEQARRATVAQEALLATQTQLADRRSRLAQIGERRADLANNDAEQERAAAVAAASLAELETQIAVETRKAAALQGELVELDQARHAQAQALAAAQDAERRLAGQLAEAQRALARLQDQQDLFSRLRDEGTGLGAGPRAVLAAAQPAAGRRAELAGVVGALGDLIEVPAQLERAIEAALGNRIQDVVVRTWEDAEAAVTFLKRTQAGRATFLPLDNLRPGKPAAAPRASGVLGLASELVKFDPVIRQAVDLALNHVIVVQDLPTARRLLGRSDGSSPTLVTLDGEIVRPTGSVTGGSENRGAIMAF